MQKSTTIHKVQIRAIAPSSHTYSSLVKFGIPIKSYLNGLHVAKMEFDTIEDAEQYLINRAEMYYESEDELLNAIDDVLQYHQLTIDGAVAHIIDEYEEEFIIN